jgi:lysylphosphatidylglycerol synthetase-like protein (DUF2156 family)
MTGIHVLYTLRIKYLNDYRKLDYKVIKVGEDALIDTEKFISETKK